ncbi:hypothetical protein EG68_09557 [Paragonimus skrjabini miyazakii]|uniref:Uncharacterized protein n=1 Tax=Paragonimus skrjabini miyazakii TaxID=59628 RepID=A0A8S9YH64_9TREM|nr:hypothetical protein EG68_09557 [Paragonimus skrjabini miyazakii]
MLMRREFVGGEQLGYAMEYQAIGTVELRRIGAVAGYSSRLLGGS